MTTAVGIPANVLIAWQALPDRECPCRRKCGRTVKIVCEDGWNDIGGWLPEKVAESPLDVDLLVQVLIYWIPGATDSQETFDREYDRLEVGLTPLAPRSTTPRARSGSLQNRPYRGISQTCDIAALAPESPGSPVQLGA